MYIFSHAMCGAPQYRICSCGLNLVLAKTQFHLVLTMDDPLNVTEGCCVEVTNSIVAGPCFIFTDITEIHKKE